MRGRQAVEGLRDEFGRQYPPEHKRRLHPGFARQVSQDRLAVRAAVQLRKASVEVGGAACMEIGRMQIRGAALEWMEERARKRRKHRLPAQQTEQRVDQRIF